MEVGQTFDENVELKSVRLRHADLAPLRASGHFGMTRFRCRSPGGVACSDTWLGQPTGTRRAAGYASGY
jgi:hypothetical protein